VDLPVFGRPSKLVWRKQRWRCINCVYCWCDDNAEITTTRCALTTRDFADESMPIEIQRLGRTIAKWAHQITAWHRSHVTNGPPKASTFSRNGSSASHSSWSTSDTTASVACSMPANPTGPSPTHVPTLKRGEPVQAGWRRLIATSEAPVSNANAASATNTFVVTPVAGSVASSGDGAAVAVGATDSAVAFSDA
jgi:hypothetical protein